MRQPCPLAGGVAVGDNVQPIPLGEVPHQLQGAGQQGPALAQVRKVGAVDLLRVPGEARLPEEVLKAARKELGLGALAPFQLGPPAVVAPLIDFQQAGGVRPLAAKAGLISGLKSVEHILVEIQQGAVGVQQQKTVFLHTASPLVT